MVMAPCGVWCGDGTQQAFLLVSSFERRQCGRRSYMQFIRSIREFHIESGFQSLPGFHTDQVLQPCCGLTSVLFEAVVSIILH